jgi:hypothetical protein
MIEGVSIRNVAIQSTTVMTRGTLMTVIRRMVVRS